MTRFSANWLDGRARLSFIFFLFLGLAIFAEHSPVCAVERGERDESLRVATPVGGSNFAQPFTRPGNAAVRFAVFDTLTREDSAGKLGPQLATSWRMDTPTSWTFTLRPGVRFHNGVAFSSAAVATTIEILQKSTGIGFDLASEVAGIARVDQIDPLTVRFILTAPDAILPRRLGLIRIIEAGAWATMGPDAYARNPIGTGPYRVAAWDDSAASTILESVPESWRAANAIQRIEIRDVADATARVQALLSGRVDVAFALSPDDISVLESAGARAHVFPGPMVMSLTMRNVEGTHPAFHDERVRRALNYAIDRASISNQIMSGAMKPAGMGFTAGVTGYNPSIEPFTYDPDRAKKLLAEAGYPDGFKFVAGVTLGQVPNDTAVFQSVAQDLKRIGVVAELRTLTFPDFLERLTSGRWNDISVFSMLWGAATYADAYRYLERHSCLNAVRYFCEPQITPKLERARLIADPLEREQALQALVADYQRLAPAIWILEYASIIGTARKLSGLDLAFEGIYFERLHWDD
ncbi:MAG: ABC transporter substrate-binding protein [Rhodospirillaceae bacterium]|nr:ABC transporter substrate-binding protein [Rhodospirillaceae bacterium]